jgi:molybdenum cofactor biosynthesis enzyme MoaA
MKHFETRILLTPHCNYRCVFCHNEGNDKTMSLQSDGGKLWASIKKMIDNGCRDITFTGGEPLMQYNLLVETIDKIRQESADIPVTIVTNASLLSDDKIVRLLSFGNIRFNISFHATTNEQYMYLTAQKRFTLNNLINRLDKLREYRMPFKMNAVALRSTMSEAKDVANIISFAKDNGAISCKIIEMLIVESNLSLLGDCLAIESVERILPRQFRFEEQNDRGRVFRDNDGFQVELRKVRCHYGCSECSKKEITCSLDDGGRFWACFNNCEQRYPLFNTDFTATINQGKAEIAKMVEQYDQQSPSLIRQAVPVAHNSSVFFIVKEQDIVNKLLSDSEIRRTAIFVYQESYFQPIDNKKDNTDKIVKCRCNQSDPQNSSLIIAQYSITEIDGLFIHNMRFPDPNGAFLRTSAEKIELFLKELGWNKSKTIDCRETAYIKASVRFSVLEIENKTTLIRIDMQNEHATEFATWISEQYTLAQLDIPLSIFAT